MGWAVWLAVPVAVTVLAALVSWWRGRPEREPDTAEAMRAHGAYLDALAETARSRDRGPFAPDEAAARPDQRAPGPERLAG